SALQHIKAFYNATWSRRYGHGLALGPLTLLYSLTVSIFALGGLVGSLLVGVLVERYGRRGALSRSALLVLLAGGFMGFSRELGSPEMVIIGRSIMGIHSVSPVPPGICLSVVPLYLGEIAPKNLRGFLGLMPSIFICLGVFFAQVLGLPELLGEARFWPLFLSVVVVPASLQLLLLHCFPESPRYLLIERNDVCGATKVGLPSHPSAPPQDAPFSPALAGGQPQPPAAAQCAAGLLRSSPAKRPPMDVPRLVIKLQAFVLLSIPCSLQPPPCRLPAPCLLHPLPQKRPLPSPAPLLGAGANAAVGPPPTLHPNRASAGPCCCLVHLHPGTEESCIFPQPLPCTLDLSPPSAAGVPFLMTAELFTQSHRPAAYIVGGSLNWLCNFTIGFVFPFLQMSAGAFCYLVFCSICLLVALYVYLVVPETKNKTFMEISHIFA
ncbi:GTR1 protein, partial [Corythaeola cristata]|nr:GTR1 protein [Corythaeola cristata]